MKYLKTILLVLVLGFIFLFFYQNREYLLTTQSFLVDLYFKEFKLPALATGFYIVFAFLLGLVVMFVASLFPRFQTTKELRQLRQDQANIERLKKENSELLDNICMLRDQTQPKETPVIITPPPAAETPVQKAPGEPEKNPASAS